MTFALGSVVTRLVITDSADDFTMNAPARAQRPRHLHLIGCIGSMGEEKLARRRRKKVHCASACTARTAYTSRSERIINVVLGAIELVALPLLQIV